MRALLRSRRGLDQREQQPDLPGVVRRVGGEAVEHVGEPHLATFDRDHALEVRVFQPADALDERGVGGPELRDDLAEAGTALEPGCSAAVLVYENTWAAPFAIALRRNGAQMVANGRIPIQAILASLDD